MGISLREIRRAGVVKISEKIKKMRIKWYGHVVNNEEGEVIMRAWREPVVGK